MSCGSTISMIGELCKKCYSKRWYRLKTGNLSTRRQKPSVCEKCGSSGKIRSRGLCGPCYSQIGRQKVLARAKTASAELSDAYVRQQLRTTCGIVNPTDEMIQTKRGIIILHRIYTQQRKLVKQLWRMNRECYAPFKIKPPRATKTCKCCGAEYLAGDSCTKCTAEEKKRAKRQRKNHTVNARARKRGIRGRLSPGLFDRLFVSQNGKCAYCGTSLSNTKPRSPLDHIVPLALGGLNVDDNIQILCKPCNELKHDRHPEEYVQSDDFFVRLCQ